ncbi:nitroreductase family protein [Maribacter sp. CXY002]|uniref:nitroreductase family protein n=1 Tax=Maribacter luteocoastalis TaxID=3407671 RepID=UPI003B67CB46
MVKDLVRKIVGSQNFTKVGDLYRILKKTYIFKFIDLVGNYIFDFKLYYLHSNVFRLNDYEKIESHIILKYHTIEKGLLHQDLRYKFGRKNIIILRNLLKKEIINEKKDNSQIQAAYIAMCDYYELHKNNSIDISDYYPMEDFDYFKSHIIVNINSTLNNEYHDYFSNANKDFYQFSHSRSSVRNFSGALVEIKTIEKVVKLASNAPSVCNRQATKVYYVDNKSLVDDVLKLQGGMTGFTKNIHQLLVVVTDRSYFYTIGERNQFYIDGGIFLLNLLYALHYFKIGACPANWGKQMDADKKIKHMLDLKSSEKVICLVPIGIPSPNFKTCTSLRRDVKELLKIV